MKNKDLTFWLYLKIFILGALLCLGFFLLDGIWLALLPRLGISFGEMPSSLILFFFLRCCLFCVWLIILILLAIIRVKATGSKLVWILAALNTLLMVLGLYGYYIGPIPLSVGRIEVPVPGLMHAVRIVQLSDIHVERNTRRELALPDLVGSLTPDMIVITGDYLNESFSMDPVSMHDLREILGQLHAPLGIYATNGNVETPKEMDIMLSGLDIHRVENEVIRVPEFGKHFVIVGLNYTDLLDDQIELIQLMKNVKADDFSLLLYHKPDLAYVARDQEVNLYLTGHTHGGQVRLPFYGALFANSRFGKTFEMGLYHLGQTTLYVSRGLGMAGGDGPRMRFLCPPEVVVVDLVPPNKQTEP